MSTGGEVKPIDFFKIAHKRSAVFISGGKGNKGRRDSDDLRAAVVFAVASIDAFFRTKIIHVLRSKRQLNGNNPSPFSESTRKIIQRRISKELFGREYNQINQREREAVDALCESRKPSLMKYLEGALNEMSFQSIFQLEDGIKMMGEKPQEIWNKISKAGITNADSVQVSGKQKKKREGRRVDLKVQIGNLFSRRHLIVHHADLSLQSRKNRGAERKISYNTVKRWIESVEKIVKKIDSIIS